MSPTSTASLTWPRLRTLTASAVLWLVALPVSLAETTKAAEAGCSELMNAGLPGLVMEAAAVAGGNIEAKDVNGSKPPLPRHWRLQGMLNSRIGFELRLPLQWNGRFVFQGGAGLDGLLQPALGDLNGSIAAWRGMRLGRSTNAKSDAGDVILGVETLRYYMLTPPEPTFDPLRFDFD